MSFFNALKLLLCKAPQKFHDLGKTRFYTQSQLVLVFALNQSAARHNLTACCYSINSGLCSSLQRVYRLDLAHFCTKSGIGLVFASTQDLACLCTESGLRSILCYVTKFQTEFRTEVVFELILRNSVAWTYFAYANHDLVCSCIESGYRFF